MPKQPPKVSGYDIQQAKLEIANLRGQVAHNSASPVQSITTGFPTGWSGYVHYQKIPPTTNLFFIDWALSAIAGTVVTAGSILCYLASGYFWSGNYSLFLDGGWNYAPSYAAPTYGVAQINNGGFATTFSQTVPSGNTLQWQGSCIYSVPN